MARHGQKYYTTSSIVLDMEFMANSRKKNNTIIVRTELLPRRKIQTLLKYILYCRVSNNNKTVSVNINKLFDMMLPKLHNIILNDGMDPLSMSDIYKKLVFISVTGIDSCKIFQRFLDS